MKRLFILVAMLVMAIFSYGQIPLRNSIVNQIANGDTLQFRIYPTNTYFNSTNPLNLVATSTTVSGVLFGLSTLQMTGNSTFNGYLYSNNNTYLGNGDDTIYYDLADGSGTITDIFQATDTAEVFRADTLLAYNNIGINVGATPLDRLHIRVGQTTDKGGRISGYSATTTDCPRLYFFRSLSNTLGTLTTTTTGTVLARIGFGGVNVSSAEATYFPYIDVTQAATSGTSVPASYDFYSPAALNATTNLRMRLNQSAYLSLGNGTSAALTSISDNIQITGGSAVSIGVSAPASTTVVGTDLTIHSGASGSAASDKKSGNVIISTAKSDGYSSTGSGDILLYTTTGGYSGGTAGTDYAAAKKQQWLSRPLIDNVAAGTGIGNATAGSYVDLDASVPHMYNILVGDGSYWATIITKTDGTTTISTNDGSGTIVNTDTDGKIGCVDAGNFVRIFNALGSNTTITISDLINQ